MVSILSAHLQAHSVMHGVRWQIRSIAAHPERASQIASLNKNSLCLTDVGSVIVRFSIQDVPCVVHSKSSALEEVADEEVCKQDSDCFVGSFTDVSGGGIRKSSREIPNQ